MMSTSFVCRPPPRPHPRRRQSPSRCPITSRKSDPPPRPNRRVRVPRKYTSKSDDWQWKGQKSTGWRNFFNVEESVFKVIEALWSKSIRVSESPILARMTALGARVLRRVTDAIARTLYPDTEKDLAAEYGLAETDQDDDTYLDPLREWETSNVTYYRDSFGRRVYLQLDGASGLIAATDYRDLYDETDVTEDSTDDDTDEKRQYGLGGTEDTYPRPNSFPRNSDFDDGSEWTYDSTPT